jgi:hypothetical protein
MLAAAHIWAAGAAARQRLAAAAVAALPVALPVAAPPMLQQQQQQQQRRLFASQHAPGSEQAPYSEQHSEPKIPLGMITPITMGLWRERGELAARMRAAPVRCPGDAGAPLPRPPQTTSVCYPFTSDPHLLELVRSAAAFVGAACRHVCMTPPLELLRCAGWQSC